MASARAPASVELSADADRRRPPSAALLEFAEFQSSVVVGRCFSRARCVTAVSTWRDARARRRRIALPVLVIRDSSALDAWRAGRASARTRSAWARMRGFEIDRREAQEAERYLRRIQSMAENVNAPAAT
jgi:hypothetical protein